MEGLKEKRQVVQLTFQQGVYFRATDGEKEIGCKLHSPVLPPRRWNGTAVKQPVALAAQKVSDPKTIDLAAMFSVPCFCLHTYQASVCCPF